MISKEALLQALAQQLQAAQAGDMHATREALSAMRALCDVALCTVNAPSVSVMSSAAHTSVQPVQTLSAVQHVEEDGANGDSIFDF